ncbi:MAG: response regulator [Halioglobus sp.]
MKILLVEDEDLLLAETAEMLVSFGHEVTIASSAEQALYKLYRYSGHEILVSDMKMPGMSGLELIRLVQASYTQEGETMRCVLVSGHLSATHAEPSLADENISFIQKPVSAKALLAEVER